MSGRPVPRALLVGVAYFLVGRLFTLPGLNTRAGRLGAWGVSLLIFALHLALELRRAPRPAATRASLHVAAGVALGACLLAVVVVARALGGATAMRSSILLAPIVWPLLLALPAFVVALAVSSLVGRARHAGPQ